MRIVSIILSLMLITSAALAQAVPVPPKPADSGPSLEATMRFIEDKLNDQGKVSYTLSFETAGEVQESGRIEQEISDVKANPATCELAWKTKYSWNGELKANNPRGFSFRTIEKLRVITEDDHWRELEEKTGAKVKHFTNPPVFLIIAFPASGGGHFFYFREDEIANRVAKAMVHAVELCGGGSKPEPF